MAVRCLIYVRAGVKWGRAMASLGANNYSGSRVRLKSSISGRSTADDQGNFDVQCISKVLLACNLIHLCMNIGKTLIFL